MTNLPATTATTEDPSTEDVAGVDDIERKLTALAGICAAIMGELVKARNFPLALKAAARLEAQYRLLAELRGLLRPVTVNTPPDEWQHVQRALLQALQPYPEARAAAAAALMSAAREHSDNGQR